MGLWYYETYRGRVKLGLKVRRSLFTKQSDYQLVEVIETEAYGKTLAIDGIYMTSERDEHYYHEMLVHPALTTVANPERVLIIGGGDGGTAREVLRHDAVKKVQLVEIDQVVVDACRAHLPDHFSWDDPRFELIIADGIQFLADAAPDSYDVVLLDGSDPVGPAQGLFNRSFYEHVKRALKPTGAFALQSEGPILMPDLFLDIVHTVRDLFAQAHPYFGPVPIYGAGIWSWTVASETLDARTPDPDRVARFARACKYYNCDIHRAAFAVPNDLARALVEN